MVHSIQDGGDPTPILMIGDGETGIPVLRNGITTSDTRNTEFPKTLGSSEIANCTPDSLRTTLDIFLNGAIMTPTGDSGDVLLDVRALSKDHDPLVANNGALQKIKNLNKNRAKNRKNSPNKPGGAEIKNKLQKPKMRNLGA